MKSWEPDQDFGRADFPSRRDPPEKPTEPVVRPAESRIAAPSFRKLKPGGVLREARSPGAAPTEKPISAQSSAGSLRAVPAAKEPPPGGEAGNVPLVDLQARLLVEAALARPERTLRLLRKWYWEKWPAASVARSNPSLAPADRIRVVFASLGERVSIYLLELMSPVERGKFQELLREERSYSRATSAVACREFMRGLQQDTL